MRLSDTAGPSAGGKRCCGKGLASVWLSGRRAWAGDQRDSIASFCLQTRALIPGTADSSHLADPENQRWKRGWGCEGGGRTGSRGPTHLLPVGQDVEPQRPANFRSTGGWQQICLFTPIYTETIKKDTNLPRAIDYNSTKKQSHRLQRLRKGIYTHAHTYAI